MAKLTQEMIQRRLETVVSGTYQPDLPGLPGLVFVKMGLKERGISARAYSSKLKELMAAGGYFSEALLPSVLERVCRENGLDLSVLKKQREILKRFYDSIPPEMADPIDQLTPEEVTLLSPEERAEREKDAEGRGQKIMEWQVNFFTEEDYKTMEMSRQIEQLEQHLKANTAEHYARKHRDETEILMCARRADDIEEPCFGSIDEIQELEDFNREGLVQLYLKWKQFKEGLSPQFFRPDPIN